MTMPDMTPHDKTCGHMDMFIVEPKTFQDFDPLDWSLNCATLSQYYITMGNYRSARHTVSTVFPICSIYSTRYT